MPFDLSVANAVPALSIELPTIVSIAAIIITVLLALVVLMVGLAGWAGKREIARNDDAHRDLKESIEASRQEIRAEVKGIDGEVKLLLQGQARIEATIAAQNPRGVRREDPASLVDIEPGRPH